MLRCARVLGIDDESLYAKLKAHCLAEQSRDATLASHETLVCGEGTSGLHVLGRWFSSFHRPSPGIVSIRRLLMLALVMCAARGQGPYFVKNALNGLAWRSLSPSDKTLYLTGASDALYVAHETLLAKASLECTRGIITASSTWFKGSLPGLRREMDEFYQSAENIPIPVMNALVLSQMKLAGAPKIESDQYRAAALKAAVN